MIFPYTASRRVALRPATAADRAEFTATALRAGIESVRPTAAPARTTPPRRAQAAFLVTRRNNGEAIGFSLNFGLSQAGHIRCGTYLDPERARLGVGSEAIGLTINYAFAMFNVDKVITETTEASFDSFGMDTADSGILNVLPEHLYFRGRYWDLHGFEVRRQEWERGMAAIADELDEVFPKVRIRRIPGNG